MTLTKEQASTLSGNELDEAVALAQGWVKANYKLDVVMWLVGDNGFIEDYHPSTNGTQCMAIMESERIGVFFADNKQGDWLASMIFMSQEKGTTITKVTGETAMIAICRCFVMSKLDVINAT